MLLFRVFMFYVGLLIVPLCFMSDVVLFIDWLYCIAADLSVITQYNKISTPSYTLVRYIICERPLTALLLTREITSTMKRNGINNVLPGRNTAAIRTATRCVYLPVVARRSTWSDYVTSCAGRWLVSSSRQSDVISAGSSRRTGVNHRRRLVLGSGGDCLKRKKTPHRTPPCEELDPPHDI